MKETVVGSSGAELFVVERGDPAAPPVLLVHGYPDTHACWDEVAARLAADLHVSAFDLRGFGRSSAPAAPDAFGLRALAADVGAVCDAVSPDRPVHLVGHDWGAFACWSAVADPRLQPRIASFTAVAGPRIDASGDWLRRRLRPDAPALAALAGQLRRSWYIGFFQVPWVPERLLGPTFARWWRATLTRREGIPPRPGHPAPTLARDARTGVALYRTNLGPLARRPRSGTAPIPVPVQLLVATRDRYISPELYADADTWARRISRRDLPGGHWLQRSHPDEVAAAVRELVRSVEPPAG